MNILRRLTAAVTHTGPGYQQPRIPARDDDFAQWVQQQRDQQQDQYGATPVWWALDSVLTAYHVHADRRLPLGAHVCEAQVAAHCTCTSQRRPF